VTQFADMRDYFRIQPNLKQVKDVYLTKVNIDYEDITEDITLSKIFGHLMGTKVPWDLVD